MAHPPSSALTTPSFGHALISLMSSLLLRPLVWLGACALLGVTLGGWCAQNWQGVARDEAPLGWFVPFLLAGLGFSWYFRNSSWRWRLGVAIAVVALSFAYTARRLLPPRDDISRLFAHPAQRDQPLRISPVRLVGIIGDYPQRSRYNIRFPLDVEKVNGQAKSGRVWVTASFNARLEVGDLLEIRTDIRPLQHPSNPGERERFWTMLGANCWCESGPLLELQVLSPGVAYPLSRRVQGVRRALLTRYESLFAGDEDSLAKRPFPHQNAALLTAMVWGESGLSEPLPQQIRDDFRAAGLSHLLASSGTQVRTTESAFFNSWM